MKKKALLVQSFLQQFFFALPPSFTEGTAVVPGRKKKVNGKKEGLLNTFFTFFDSHNLPPVTLLV